MTSRPQLPTYSYEYLNSVTVAGVSPSGGPHSGGTVVTLYGDGFQPGRMRCRFCGSVVEASFVSGVAARCVSPVHGDDARMTRGGAFVCLVSVSVNSNEFSAFRSQFTYRDPAHVNSNAPASGPQLGMTRVSVRGSGFSGVGSPKCRFGAHFSLFVLLLFFSIFGFFCFFGFFGFCIFGVCHSYSA